MSDARSKIQVSATDNWRRAILSPDATIQQTIRNLNEVAIQIVLVVNENGEMEGTVSDGDIRRGLLKGMELCSPISDIVNRNPLVVPPGLERDLVMQLMAANKVRQIPIVDEHKEVIGLHLWDEILSPRVRENVMIIMAGGLGTRLRPHTETCPKPMLPISGKPMLEHILERGRLEGFRHFVLAIHYLGAMIEDYFGDGSRWGVQIEYLKEESPLGTAGALALLPQPALPFVVTNGDVITDIRYGELLDFHERQLAAATMAVRLYEWQHPFGVVQMQGVEIAGFEEKPVSRTHINAGVYALDPSALGLLQRGQHCDMPTLFERLRQEQRRTVAYPMHEPWLDVGRPNDLAAANNAIQEKQEGLR
jgi:dTDP-glucose pyrophosphorylase/predicted transcriptional regulator